MLTLKEVGPGDKILVNEPNYHRRGDRRTVHEYTVESVKRVYVYAKRSDGAYGWAKPTGFDRTTGVQQTGQNHVGGRAVAYTADEWERKRAADQAREQLAEWNVGSRHSYSTWQKHDNLVLEVEAALRPIMEAFAARG